MTRFPHALALALAMAAMACDKSTLPANWVTVPDRASHESFFPIATGAHSQADCNSCHGTFDTFKMFTCTTCHTQPQINQAHQSVTGYASDGPSCVGCHPKGTGAPANHTPNFFPIGAGSAHAAVACTQCHLKLSTPNDPTAFGCYACHSALPTGWPHPNPVSNVTILTIHTGQTASTPVDLTNPASCLRCHADSQVNTVASHPSGGDGDPSKNSNHAGAGCLTCHSAMRTDKPFGANFATAPGCVVCHPNGTGAPANHTPSFFPIGSGTSHAAVACTQCHLNLATPNDPTQFRCYACHSTLSSWNHPATLNNVAILTVHTSQTQTRSVDITKPENCLRCHADSQVNTVASHPSSGDSGLGNGNHAGAGCLTCHSAMRTDKPFGANFGTTPAIGSGTGCGTCHATRPN